MTQRMPFEKRESQPGVLESHWGSDVVLTPARPITVGSAGSLGFETRMLDSGAPVVVGFSSVDKLVDALGEYQPWLAVTAEQLARVADDVGLGLVVDPTIDPGAPRWERKDLVAGASNSAGPLDPELDNP